MTSPTQATAAARRAGGRPHTPPAAPAIMPRPADRSAGNTAGTPAGEAAFDRDALIENLVRLDDPLADILAKRPRDLTEDEVRQVSERRLMLPAGPEKEALFRFEKAFYDHAFGAGPAQPDATGRTIAPEPRHPLPKTPVPARTADGEELGAALGQIARKVADAAEAEGAHPAVRALQSGLNTMNRAAAAAGDGAPAPGDAPAADLKDDGEPGPKTRAALRRAAARLGAAKVEEAMALGRFDAALRDMEGGPAEGLQQRTAAAFAPLFREPGPGGGEAAETRPTEEGESLQMAINDVGAEILGAGDFAPVAEDGVIGPKTEAAFRRVLAAAGPARMTDAMGRSLGFFMFDGPGDRKAVTAQSAERAAPKPGAGTPGDAAVKARVAELTAAGIVPEGAERLARLSDAGYAKVLELLEHGGTDPNGPLLQLMKEISGAVRKDHPFKDAAGTGGIKG